MMKANPAYADKILEANQRLAAELRSCRKELEAKDETIARQADDIAWLKYALARALEDHGGRVVVRDSSKPHTPEFKLEENLSGEMIVCLVRV